MGGGHVGASTSEASVISKRVGFIRNININASGHVSACTEGRQKNWTRCPARSLRVVDICSTVVNV